MAKASTRYWTVAPTVLRSNLTLSPIVSLAEPLRRANCAGTGPGVCRPLGDAALIPDAYALLGLAGGPGVDLVSWQGVVMGTPFGLSVYAANQKVATVLTAASEAAARLCPGFDTAATPRVQLAAATALVRVLLSKPTPAARLEALASPVDIAAAFAGTIDQAAAPDSGLACTEVRPSEAELLLPVLAKVGWVARQGAA